ncbi:hypothetical protein ACWIVY_08795 [Ursidibacter sp. B-7004-1]
MIFQKKIIIGSIMSFIATGVGVIAVFFPDLLNLQKKKMETIDIAVEDINSFEKVSSFLKECALDKKLFQLNLEACSNIHSDSEIQENQGLVFGKMDDYFNEPTLTKFELSQEGRDINSLNECDHWCAGISYSFPESSTSASSIHKESKCSVYGMGSTIINGFFVHENTDYTKGEHEFHNFKLIPKESVLLKDY